ncbi:MAG: MerR family DNA-binding transcriptional regulator, partial [Nevskia sp.]|nr:MerR family DNA-binding transcriptional regulator [Nevskia sp.]
MKIGELAQRTGLAPSTIRFYEAQGLISQVRRQANGYREYPSQAVQIVEIIITAQAGGFSLEQIRHLLPQPGMEKWNKDQLLATLRHKVAEIELLQKRLRENRARLLQVIRQTEKPGLPCAENAERVMSQLT